MSNHKARLLVMGVSLFEGMAGTKRVGNIIKYLIQDHEVKVFNITDNLFVTSQRDKTKDTNGIKFIDLGLNTKYFLLKMVAYLVKGSHNIILLKKRRNENIIYHYGYPNIKNVLLLVIGKIIGYKVIFDIVEDNLYMDNFKDSKSKFKTQSSNFLIKIINLLSHECIVISSHLEKKMRALNLKRLNIHLIPISIDTDVYTNERCNINKENGSFKLFYGGSFGDKDGIEYLLGAFNKVCKDVANIELTITGHGPDRYYQKLKTSICNSPFRDRIHFLGYLNEEDYLKELLSSSILCMTRTNSLFSNAGFPFKLGEYLSTGIPTIATRVGDVQKYLTNKKNSFLVNPESVDDIYECIMQVFYNYNIALNIANRGKQVAKQYFNARNHSDYIYYNIINKWTKI